MLKFFNRQLGNNRARNLGVSKPAEFVVDRREAKQPLSTETNGHQINVDFGVAHQRFIASLKEMLKAGYSQAVVQAKWQEYYNQLTPRQKELIWQRANQRINQTSSNPATNPTKTSPMVKKGYQVSDLVDQTPPNQPTAPIKTTTPISPKTWQKLLPPFGRKASNSRNVNQTAVQLQNRSSTLTTVDPHLHPSLQTKVKPANLAQLMPDTRISHRTRNALNWNSTRALFDKETSSSIWRQNVKSAVFGLTVGAIVFVSFQFTFFNERWLQPFIQPSTISNDVQILIPPGERTITDPTWKVIIPKLGIAPRVESGVEAYRSVKTNESATAFENRMQDALEKGVVHYPTSQLPGYTGQGVNSNVVILGHSASNIFAPGSYKSIFSKLGDMEVDELLLLNYKKKQYVYKIYEKKVIKPSQVEVLGPAARNNSLTLITCDPPGSNKHRLVLVAEQISPSTDDNLYIAPDSINNKGVIVPGNSRSFTEILFD